MQQLICRLARRMGAITAIMLACGPFTTALADSFPDRPIKLIIPFPPGGSTDVIARLLAQELGNQLHQKVIAENKAGASGAIATQALASAKPDGYTLCFCTTGSIVILPLIDRQLPYKPGDVVPVTHLVNQPFGVVVRSNLGVNTMADLVALARKEPGKITFGSPGTSTPSHLTGELLNEAAGIKLTHVPYRGDTPAVADLLGGQIDAMFASAVILKQLMSTGKVKLIAMTSTERLKDFPDVPTIAESGYPGFQTYNFGGLFAPAHTPASVLDTLHRAALASMQSPSLRERMVGDGLVVVGDGTQAFSATLRSEQVRWGRVAASSAQNN